MEKEFKIELDMIMALLQGKKLCFSEYDFRLTIYPPQGQLTMTYDEFEEIKRNVNYDKPEKLFKMFSKIMKENEKNYNHYLKD